MNKIFLIVGIMALLVGGLFICNTDNKEEENFTQSLQRQMNEIGEIKEGNLYLSEGWAKKIKNEGVGI